MVIFLVILAIILYTAFDLFVAKAGGKINDNLAATIFNGLGAIIPLIIYLAVKSKSNTATTNEGVIYSVLAGISIAAFSIILVNIFARAENVSFVLPAIYGGTVVLGAIAGVFIFKESLTPLALGGVVLVTIGLSMLIYARITA